MGHKESEAKADKNIKTKKIIIDYKEKKRYEKNENKKKMMAIPPKNKKKYKFKIPVQDDHNYSTEIEFKWDPKPDRGVNKTNKKYVWEIEGVDNERIRGIDEITNAFVTISTNMKIEQQIYDEFLAKKSIDLGDNIRFEGPGPGSTLRVVKLVLFQASDARPIATKIYKNEFDEYLFFFNNMSDHTKIPKQNDQPSCKATKIKLIPVKDGKPL